MLPKKLWRHCFVDKAAANKSIYKSRAGQCNISYVQASAAVRARLQCSALVHNFNNISNGHLYRAGQSMNSLPSQILERWAAYKIDP